MTNGWEARFRSSLPFTEKAVLCHVVDAFVFGDTRTGPSLAIGLVLEGFRIGLEDGPLKTAILDSGARHRRTP